MTNFHMNVKKKVGMKLSLQNVKLHWNISPLKSGQACRDAVVGVFFSLFIHCPRCQTNHCSLSSVIRSPAKGVAMTLRAASTTERRERCRRSEISCRAPPRCSAPKVSAPACDSLLWAMFNFYLVPLGYRILRVEEKRV